LRVQLPQAPREDLQRQGHAPQADSISPGPAPVIVPSWSRSVGQGV